MTYTIDTVTPAGTQTTQFMVLFVHIVLLPVGYCMVKWVIPENIHTYTILTYTMEF